MKLDYTLKTPEERIEYVNQVLANEPLNDKYLEYISDYILFVADKNQTKKEHYEENPIITKNREVTINKRQISFEEVVSNLENGEDGLYALITNDKNQIMDHKEPISQEDIEQIPGIKENLELITTLKKQLSKAKGKSKYSLKRQIIETWQQIYLLKASTKTTPAMPTQIRNLAHVKLDPKLSIDADGNIDSHGQISLVNPEHVSLLLCYYPQLKQELADNFECDMYYLLLDLERYIKKTLPQTQNLYDLLKWKVLGKTNQEIQDLMYDKYNVQHTSQYISALWRKRIPRIIAEEAQKEFLEWYYTSIEYGSWKTCGKCGKTKLAHPLFFSKNTTKDGYYSICKECRSKNNGS